MTKVIKVRRYLAAVTTILFGACALKLAPAQNASPSSSSELRVVGKSSPIQLGPAEALYLQLRSVGLDKSRVYRLRDVTLDRSALHITLDDGTIAFTQDVGGHVTGAFFEGEGEILLTPPDRTERASMALFTNEAILEESFASVYLRFNDNTFVELQPYLKPTENSADFVSKWDNTARSLAEGDALRLLMTFSRDLPVAGQTTRRNDEDRTDQMLHARVQGRKLGSFDANFDSTAVEPVCAGQLKTINGVNYYDLWTSFTVPRPQAGSKGDSQQDSSSGNPDVVSITDYKIQTRVTPPTRIESEAILRVAVQHGGDRALLFELSRSLRITSVQADGQPVEFIHNPAIEGTQLAHRGNDFVAVVFPGPLLKGQTIDLRFTYAGDVLSEAGPGLLYVGARGTWYPNRGLVMANFDLHFQYPADWTLIATGKITGETTREASSEQPKQRDSQAGEQSNRWVSERPIPVAGFNLGKYQRGSARAGSVVVDAYATSSLERYFAKPSSNTPIPGGTSEVPQRVVQFPNGPSPARNAQSVAESSAAAVEFFSRHFGPYPFSSLALTQIPGAESQGWPGLIFLSSLAFLSRDEISQLHMPDVDKAILKQVIAHETAHQWWGDSVSWTGYRDQWWVEALANYSSLMLLETQNPAQFHAILEKYRSDLLVPGESGKPLTDDGPVSLGVRLSCSEFPSGYTAISYGRGTWLFHMLRGMLRDAEHNEKTEPTSDEPFLRALRRLRDRYDGRAIGTRDLLAVFEEELPPSMRFEGRRSLDWFFNGWINGVAIPRYDLKQLKFSDKTGSTTVSGVLMQKDSPDDLVTPVPIYASHAGKLVFLGRVFADGAETPFQLMAPVGTRKVVVDPHETILSRLP